MQFNLANTYFGPILCLTTNFEKHGVSKTTDYSRLPQFQRMFSKSEKISGPHLFLFHSYYPWVIFQDDLPALISLTHQFP